MCRALRGASSDVRSRGEATRGPDRRGGCGEVHVPKVICFGARGLRLEPARSARPAGGPHLIPCAPVFAPVALAALVALAPPAPRGGASVELEGPRWRALVEGARAPGEAPGPWVDRRELEFSTTPGGIEVRGRWVIRGLRPGWFMGDVLGPEFEVREALWGGEPAAVSSSDAGTTVAGFVRGQVELRVVAFLPEEAAQPGAELRLMPAARGRLVWATGAGERALAIPGGGLLPRDGAVHFGGAPRLLVRAAPEAAAEGEALVVASAGIGLTVGDAAVQVRARLRWQVRRGQVERVSVQVPGVGADLEVSGVGVRAWRRSGDRIEVELQAPLRDRLDLEVRWSASIARASESSFAVPRIEPEGVWRTEAAVQIARDGEVEVVPELAGWTAVPAAALPGWARDLVEGTPTAAYASGEARGGRLDLLRFEPEPGPAAVIDVADYTIAASHEGRLLIRGLLEVRNERASHLRITPPPGTRIVGVRVGAEAALPARERGGGGAWRVPLRRSVETVKGALSFPVEVILIGEDTPWRRRERRRLTLPTLSAPVAVTRLTLHLPPGYTSRLGPGDGDVVRDFDRGEGITYGFGSGEVGAAEADARFQQAVDAWLKNDFDAAQRELDALRGMGARSDNIDRLQANLDVVSGGEGRRGEGSVERRIKEQARARASAELQEQAEVERRAEEYRQVGDYERAEQEYSRALEIGEKLAKLEQAESVEQKARNVAISAGLASAKKKAKERGPRRPAKAGSSAVVDSFDEDLAEAVVAAQDDRKDRSEGPDRAEPAIEGASFSVNGASIAGRLVRPEGAPVAARDSTAVVVAPPAVTAEVGGASGSTGAEDVGAAMPEPAPPEPSDEPPRDVVMATKTTAEVVALTPGRARLSRGLLRGRRQDKAAAAPPPPPPPADNDGDGVLDGRDLDDEGAPVKDGAPALDRLPPPQVSAAALSVIVPAAGEAVRYQHLLLAADAAYSVEIRAREPLLPKRRPRR